MGPQIAPLRHDALTTEFTGVSEEGFATAEVLTAGAFRKACHREDPKLVALPYLDGASEWTWYLPVRGPFYLACRADRF